MFVSNIGSHPDTVSVSLAYTVTLLIYGQMNDMKHNWYQVVVLVEVAVCSPGRICLTPYLLLSAFCGTYLCWRRRRSRKKEAFYTPHPTSQDLRSISLNRLVPCMDVHISSFFFVSQVGAWRPWLWGLFCTFGMSAWNVVLGSFSKVMIIFTSTTRIDRVSRQWPD